LHRLFDEDCAFARVRPRLERRSPFVVRPHDGVERVAVAARHEALADAL
jgi:hypothetical protein